MFVLVGGAMLPKTSINCSLRLSLENGYRLLRGFSSMLFDASLFQFMSLCIGTVVDVSVIAHKRQGDLATYRWTIVLARALTREWSISI